MEWHVVVVAGAIRSIDENGWFVFQEYIMVR
jgi:hypothetical protein